MRLPLWIRRLPHNLSTIRPAVSLDICRYCWSLGINVFFDAAPGDENYLFHFNGAGVELSIGPINLNVGLIDTPERNAWIE